ncbi:MAG: hypothetical protein GXO71_07745 [Caldiserica bacterium]|nr:hypothetical protein [Caldisericota bacterium]
MQNKINPWVEGRREEYLRDLVEKFFYCREIFARIWKEFQEQGKVDGEVMDEFIGTAEERGVLWQLKDLTHALLDRPLERITHDFAFERSIHLLFHDLMSFKEHVYVVNQFTETISQKYSTGDRKLTLVLKKFQHLVSIMEEEIPEEIKLAHSMFDIAKDLLRSMLPRWKGNALIIRYLLDNSSILEKNYGRGASKKILEEIFPEGIEYAYLVVAEWCKRSGRNDTGLKYIRKAEKINPENKKIKALKEKMQ